MKPVIDSPSAISDIVQELGFLPFFVNDIPDFSIEEMTPSRLWFQEPVEGPWEWKGPVIQMGGCVYGKFFGKKAGYVSLEWFADFANARRGGRCFEELIDFGKAPQKDIDVYSTIESRGSILTKELKRLLDYRKGGNTGFETVITRLQMQTYVVIADFEYAVDKRGRQYGWGIARYSLAESIAGETFMDALDGRTPEESRERIVEHLMKVLPHADVNAIKKLVG